MDLQNTTWFADGTHLNSIMEGNKVSILKEDANAITDVKASLTFDKVDTATVTVAETHFDMKVLFALVDGLFALNSEVNSINFKVDTSFEVDHSYYLYADVISPDAHQNLIKNSEYELWVQLVAADTVQVTRASFYQSSNICIQKTSRSHYPAVQTFVSPHYRPIRVNKPTGVVYKRYIPWLKQTLTFERFEKSKHLAMFHNWMNDPVVDEFWEESGSLEKHEAYIDSKNATDSHTVCLIAALDDKCFGYFEVYWAKEDRISPYYQAQDFDRGWHVLIGEAAFRGREYLTAWMPSISHYMLLDDIRTNTIVIEPRIDNEKMKRSLSKCGYAHHKTFDFPHKTAMLGMLSREQFFMKNVLVPLKN